MSVKESGNKWHVTRIAVTIGVKANVPILLAFPECGILNNK